MSIAVACGCGQSLSVPDAYAGQTVRCTSCSAQVLVPAGDTSPAPVVTASDAPRRRGPVRPLLLAGVAVLFLAAAGVALIWLFRRPTVSADFDLVPRDAQGFLSVRIADLLETPAGRRLREEMGDAAADAFKQAFGLPMEDVERFTLVVANGSTQQLWFLIHTRAKYSRATIRQTLETHFRWDPDGKTIWKSRTDRTVHFATDHLYIVAPNEPSVLLCLDLPAKPGAGPLNDALKQASQNREHVVAAINLDAPGARDNVLQELERMVPPGNEFIGAVLKSAVAQLVRARMGGLTIVADDALHLAATGEFLSDDDAGRAKDVLENMRLFLPKLQTSRDGTSLSATLDLDAAALGRLLRLLLR